MRSPKPRPKRRAGGNRLVRVIVVAFAVWSSVSIIRLQADVATRRQELAGIQQKCEQQRLENRELELQLSQENDAEYTERTAREKLDFVYPEERVFIASGG